MQIMYVSNHSLFQSIFEFMANNNKVEEESVRVREKRFDKKQVPSKWLLLVIGFFIVLGPFTTPNGLWFCWCLSAS